MASSAKLFCACQQQQAGLLDTKSDNRLVRLRASMADAQCFVLEDHCPLRTEQQCYPKLIRAIIMLPCITGGLHCTAAEAWWALEGPQAAFENQACSRLAAATAGLVASSNANEVIVNAHDACSLPKLLESKFLPSEHNAYLP